MENTISKPVYYRCNNLCNNRIASELILCVKVNDDVNLVSRNHNSNNYFSKDELIDVITKANKELCDNKVIDNELTEIKVIEKQYPSFNHILGLFSPLYNEYYNKAFTYIYEYDEDNNTYKVECVVVETNNTDNNEYRCGKCCYALEKSYESMLGKQTNFYNYKEYNTKDLLYFTITNNRKKFYCEYKLPFITREERNRVQDGIYNDFIKTRNEDLWDKLDNVRQRRFFDYVTKKLNMKTIKFCMSKYIKDVHGCSELGDAIVDYLFNNDLEDYEDFYEYFSKIHVSGYPVIKKVLNASLKENHAVGCFISSLMKNNDAVKYIYDNFKDFIKEWYDTYNCHAFTRFYENSQLYGKWDVLYNKCKDVIMYNTDKMDVEIVKGVKNTYYSCKKCTVKGCNSSLSCTEYKKCKQITNDEVYCGKKEVNTFITSIDDIGKANKESIRKYLFDNNITSDKCIDLSYNTSTVPDITEFFYIFDDLHEAYDTKHIFYNYELNGRKFKVEYIVRGSGSNDTEYLCSNCNMPLIKSSTSSLKNKNTYRLEQFYINNSRYNVNTEDIVEVYRPNISNPMKPKEFVDIVEEVIMDNTYLIHNKMQVIKHFFDGVVPLYDKNSTYTFDFMKYILDEDHIYMKLLKKDKELHDRYVAIINTFLKRIGLILVNDETYKDGFFVHCLNDILN